MDNIFNLIEQFILLYDILPDMRRRSQSKTIKSDETLFAIISYLKEHGPAGTTKIATNIDISKSTVHGHLTTLKQHGFVTDNEGEYQIGFKFLDYGKSVQLDHILYPKIIDSVDRLSEETKERAWCMIEENGRGYYLYGSEGEHSINPPVRTGTSVYLHQTAGGKAMLANMPSKRLNSILENHGLPEKTENTITDRDVLYDELETIREQGFAVNREESLKGLCAIGAPIQNSTDEIIGALSVSGPTNRLNVTELKEEIALLLRGTTNELEINIKYE